MKREVTAIFLYKYVVKKLASNHIGSQFLFSKESEMEYTVIQINKQASKQKSLQYDLKPKWFYSGKVFWSWNPTRSKKPIIMFPYFRRGFEVLQTGFQSEKPNVKTLFYILLKWSVITIYLKGRSLGNILKNHTQRTLNLCHKFCFGITLEKN